MQSQKFQYGNDFLLKLASSVITDKQFLIKCSDLEIGKYIESQPHQWMINKCIEYFFDFKMSPSLDNLKIMIDNIKQPLLKQSVSNVYIDILEVLDSDSLQELQFIKSTAIHFCRAQQLKFAIMKSIDIMQDSQDYEQVYQIINKTRFKGLDSNLGVEYVDSFYRRHEIKPEKTIQMPWPVVNGALNGGMKQGRLYLVLAPPGVGKSWMFCNIAAQAIKQKKKVVYYTLQMTQDEIGARIDSKLTGKSLSYIRHPNNLDKIHEQLLPYKNYLRVKQFLPNKTRLIQCENHYNQLKLFQNFDAELVIIDYGDILKKQGNINNMYVAYGDIFTGMKTLAKQYKIPVVSGSQGGRSSIESQIVLGDQTSHSMGKIQIADTVISMSRTHSDKMSNTARFTIVKNRGGKDGMVYNGIVDLDIGDIQMYDTYTKKSVQTREKMDNNDALVKQRIKQRLMILNKNKQENKI